MKLLCIIGDLDVGGAETFIIKVFKNINREKYIIDFLLFTEKECAYNREVKDLGGTIIVATSKEKNLIKSFFEIYKIVKNGNYRNVLKVSEYSIGAIDLFAAMLAGAKKRAYRSTNSGSLESEIKLIIHKMLIPFLNMTSNILIAPSTEAALFTFGKRAVMKHKVNYLNNGVPLDKFIISSSVTQRKKEELHIENKYIIGHIGRFSKQKNHKYIIDVFEKVHSINKDSVLLLIGEGELKNEISKYVNDKELYNYVIFLGIRKDIPELLSTMDVMILPSLYEGMPNVLIEAQAMGLPAVVSDTITKESNITGLVKYLSLSESTIVWAHEILSSKKQKVTECHTLLRNKGYDLNNVIDNFVSLTFGE